MKKVLIFLVLTLVPMLASADPVEIDGIYYNLNSDGNVAEVTDNPNKYSGDVVIPASVAYEDEEYSVTTIGEWAFSNCSGLTSVTIPNSVTSIGNSAFYGCSSLTSITIPNSVTSIGGLAFYGCSNLAYITIPNSVTSIGGNAFSECSGLTSVTIPNSVTSIGGSAFSSCSALTSIVVETGNPTYDSPDNCNAIIETASNTLLYGCMNTTIPNSVTSIGSSAFYGCSGLTSIKIPSSVTSIGGSAFSGCSGLTSITIPSSVTSIDEYAFSHCSGLISIIVEAGNPNFDSRNNCNAIIETSSNTLIMGCKNTVIPNSVTNIGSSAFDGCTSLISITIPNSVTSIGSCAFEDCSGLTSITIPNSVTSIGSCAFIRCTGLTSITIPNSLTSIVSQAFMGCTGLTSVTIPKSITKIGLEAFYGCANLASVTCQNPVPPTCDIRAFNTFTASLYVPAGSSIQYKAADIWRNFVTINEMPPVVDGIYYNLDENSKTAEVTRNPNNYSGDVVIPASVTYENVEYSVTSIGNQAFLGYSGLNSISIPNSVTSIGDFAFWGCSGLTSVSIGNSVTNIGSAAFSYCSGLTSVHISDIAAWCNISFGDNPLPYAQHLYLNGDEVKDLNIPNSVTSINACAFSGCKGLTSITIPNSVTNIGSSAFYDCSGLTSITIGNSVTSIGDCAFQNCSGLTCVTIPNSVTNIGYCSFFNCPGLTSITIPNSVTSIGSYAFDGTKWYYNQPDGLVYAGKVAYNYKGEMPANTTIVLEEGTLGIAGSAFAWWCSGLTSITIPNSVTSINDQAFYGCTGLTSVTIPNSVTSIGGSAFSGCSGLSTLIIGSGIETIDYSVFVECPNLEDVYCYAVNVPSTETNAFEMSNPESATLHVPDASLNAYKTTEPWSQFGTIVALTDDDPKPTGIENVNYNGNVNNRWYSLAGQLLQGKPTQQGVYIHNGKKVVIK